MAEAQSTGGNFVELIRKSRRGKFKIYIGMSAGVGKTYRMLQESRMLLASGIDIRIGYIETHGRAETEALLEGLPLIPRRKLFYKGKELEEMDLQTILNVHPEVVVVDELAHTNIGGSRNEKRWQDVMDILEEGINVISAVNIQHLESLNAQIESITGTRIRERIPDRVIQMADEVVNIDLTADELIERLKEGKIYLKERVETALQNFFRADRLLRLREIALKEVASQVERQIEKEMPPNASLRPEAFLVCISSNAQMARKLIRKAARLSSYYQSRWYVLYVQRKKEYGDRIPLAAQRHLIDNFKLATQLGAEVIR
ncbi:MAG TPA: sensor histidine kinase KdpD, partial [Chitinophagaceae bacterium]|nr:sensor histidine kinase KdpD [Chitinophagaceae bacterium]